MHQKSSSSTERRNSFPRIDAVILDYGKVLARCPTTEEFGRMARMFNVSFEVFYALWEASRSTYDRGDLTAEEYWLQLAAQTNTLVDHGQIEVLRKVEVEIWTNMDSGMLDWLRQLYAAGIKTGLLSNMPMDLATHVRTNCSWMENFTFKTFSAEVQLIKPGAAIYQHTLDGLGVPAGAALFVDDRENNIQAARALGMHAIQFGSIAGLRDDLQGLGFPILPSATAASPVDRPAQESKFSPLL